MREHGQARAYVDLGEIARAEEILNQGDRRAKAGQSQLVVVDIRHVRAVLAVRHRQWDHAIQELEEGLEIVRPMPYPYAEGRFLRLYGEVHRLRKEPGAARERLTTALAIFARLGARKDSEQAARELAAFR
jgi:hypothetical protein